MTAEIFTSPQSSHGFEQRVTIKTPPMATLVIKFTWILKLIALGFASKQMVFTWLCNC